MDSTAISHFFTNYGTDLATGDGTRIVANYDTEVLLLSDRAAKAVENGAEFASHFSAASAIYLAQGFGQPEASATRFEDVTPQLALVWVTWRYRSTDGTPLYDADYVYVLRTDGEQPHIAMALSINEAERAAEYAAAKMGSS